MDFPETLRAAVATRGLSLGEISRLLRERGTPVSVSGLSAWQSGVSRPERAASLRALHELEDLLGLRPDQLRSRLPRKPRDDRTRRAAPPVTWRDPAPPARVLGALGSRLNDPGRPEMLSGRYRVSVGADGCQATSHTSRLVRAGAAGATRLVRISEYDALPGPPRIVPLLGVSIGRSSADPAAGLVAFELLLDPPLGPGECGLVEWVTLYPPGLSDPSKSVVTDPATRELTLEVQFAPARPPATVERYSTTDVGKEPVATPLPGGNGVHQFVHLNPEPGTHGIRWSWSDQA